LLLRVDLRKASADLARRLGESEGAGQAALPQLVGRNFEAGRADGKTIERFEARHDHAATVERLGRGGAVLEPGLDEVAPWLRPVACRSLI